MKINKHTHTKHETVMPTEENLEYYHETFYYILHSLLWAVSLKENGGIAHIPSLLLYKTELVIGMRRDIFKGNKFSSKIVFYLS